MKFITDPIINTSKELAALSTRVFDGSVEFLKSTWNSIPLFAGTKAHLGLEVEQTLPARGALEEIAIPPDGEPSRPRFGTYFVTLHVAKSAGAAPGFIA